MDLNGAPPSEYGEKYREHFLALFKDFVKSADAISARRYTANQVFLTLNSTVIGLVGYLRLGATEAAASSLVYSAAAVVGMAFCYTWYHLIQSFKTLNGAKFDVINEMEKSLPVKTYTAEW